MAVKKHFESVIAFLEENAEKKVGAILPELIDMVSTKRNQASFLKAGFEQDAEIIAILDSYYGRWMPLVGDQEVEFGVKANTTTGLYGTCKQGLSQYTKQNNLAKKKLANILGLIENGEIEEYQKEGENLKDTIARMKEEIEAERSVVVSTDLGFETKEEVEEYLVDLGYAPVAG